MPFQRFLRPLLAAAALFASVAASAQQVTHIVVPFNAGGATDGYVRAIADEMTKHGIRTIVDNKPGASGMIRTVTFEKTEFADIPNRFEAGTPPIAEAIGLAAAIDYVTALGFDRIAAHEHAVLTYATERLSDIPGLRIIGTARKKASIVSFVLENAHPHDIGTVLDESGVAVRAGHHCAQPLMDRFGIAGTARASFGLYNGFDDVDALVDGLGRVKEIFG